MHDRSMIATLADRLSAEGEDVREGIPLRILHGSGAYAACLWLPLQPLPTAVVRLAPLAPLGRFKLSPPVAATANSPREDFRASHALKRRVDQALMPARVQ
jgi:hypothetical protein